MLQAAKRAGAAFAGAQLPTQSGPARSYLPDERPGWVDVQTELLLTGTAGPEAVAGQQRGDQLPEGHMHPPAPECSGTLRWRAASMVA